MRKKAEQRIRQAAAMFDSSYLYRIDKVREGAGLIKKVFDKTILDMARVGTIELAGGDTGKMSASETDNLIRQGDTLHVYFKFSEAGKAAGKKPPETIDVTLHQLDRQLWQRFEYLCGNRENKNPAQKIEEMVREYVQKTAGPDSFF